MEDKNNRYELLVKYITEETTLEEQEDILSWINQSPENKALYFEVKDIIDYSQHDHHQHKSRKLKLSHAYIKYAAAILLILAASVAVFNYYNATPSVISIASTHNEKIKKIVLPDRSVVWLKPGSLLEYDEDFNGASRAVRLTGQAFFEVRKILDEAGKRKSFTVHSANLKVSVLGTSFDVIESKKISSVVVRTGLVKTQSGNHQVLLHPGDRARLSGGTLVRDKVNAELFASWRTGDYKFEKTTITEVVQLLENYTRCNVVLLNPDKFRNTSLIGRVQAKTENQLLGILSVMLSAKITKQNLTITIN